MKDIYTWADQTLVWIHVADDGGAQLESIRRALALTRKASALCLLPVDDALPVPRAGFTWSGLRHASERIAFRACMICRLIPVVNLFWTIKSLCLGLMLLRHVSTNACKDDLDTLLAHEWFRRAWTYQEALLSCNITVLCGNNIELPWSRLMRGLGRLSEMQRRKEAPLPSTTTFYFRRTAKNWFTHASSMPHPYFTLEGLFRAWYRFDRPSSRLLWRPKKFRCQRSPSSDVEVGLSTTTKTATALLDTRHAPEKIVLTIIVTKYSITFGTICFFIFLLSLLIPSVSGSSPMFTSNFATASISQVALALIDTFCRKCCVGQSVDAWKEDPPIPVWDYNGVLIPRAVVLAMRYRQTSEVRDTAYAYYGVLDSLGVELCPLDYRKNEADTVRDICIDLLTWDPATIMMLIDAGRLHNDDPGDARPSWTPRWQTAASRSVVLEGYLSNVQLFAQMDTSLIRVAVIQGGAVLRVSGYVFDTVSVCCSPFSHLDAQSSLAMWTLAVHQFSDWVRTLMEVMRDRTCLITYTGQGLFIPSIEPPIPFSTNIVTIYVILLLGQAQSYCANQDPDNLSTTRLASSFIAKHLISDPTLTTLGLARLLLDAPRRIVQSFYFTINRMADLQIQPFVTDGGLVGCGSKGMVQGDKLAMIAGVPAPIVLRPRPSTDEFEVVCSAFVLGHMSGIEFEPDRLGDIDLV